MGQQANSGRNASLDNRKQRAAGRQQNTPEQRAITEAAGLDKDKGRAGGAFGRQGQANPKGRGASPRVKDSHITTGAKRK